MSCIPSYLPDNARLTLKEISSYTGVGEKALASRVKRCTIPKQHKKFRVVSKSRLYWEVGFVRANLGLFL